MRFVITNLLAVTLCFSINVFGKVRPIGKAKPMTSAKKIVMRKTQLEPVTKIRMTPQQMSDLQYSILEYTDNPSGCKKIESQNTLLKLKKLRDAVIDMPELITVLDVSDCRELVKFVKSLEKTEPISVLRVADPIASAQETISLTGGGQRPWKFNLGSGTTSNSEMSKLLGITDSQTRKPSSVPAN